MNTLARVFYIFSAISLVLNGCAALPAQARQEKPKAAVYETIIGKSLTDKVVADFISSNNCSSADQFWICTSMGMALWIDSNQVVETVYLYLNKTDDFKPYKGELPYGLKFYDSLGAVEYKLRRRGVGNGGLPDIGVTPDHLHYRAIYQEAGLTIIYNEPFPDEDATIYAILVASK